MRNVVITGFGIKSCIGNTYQEVLDSLQNGKSGITANETYKQMIKHQLQYVSVVDA